MNDIRISPLASGSPGRKGFNDLKYEFCWESPGGGAVSLHPASVMLGHTAMLPNATPEIFNISRLVNLLLLITLPLNEA
jgi:hypothetical protein